MEYINYLTYGKCVRLANQEIEIIITLEVGPRIIRCGFIGEKNLFADNLSGSIKVPSGVWKSYGGHRLWAAPESFPRTYVVDMETCVEEIENGIKVITAVEPDTKMHKEFHITMDSKSNQITINHLLYNHHCWDVETALWPVSVMTTGGVAILSLPEVRSHEGNLLPTHNMSVWRYTDMADARWLWGSEYILLKQDDSIKNPQKIGMFSLNGELAYAVDGYLFVKSFDVDPDATYPDKQTNLEVYTQPGMLELETLSPIVKISPDDFAEHKEIWKLYKNVPQPSTEKDVKSNIEKYLSKKK